MRTVRVQQPESQAPAAITSAPVGAVDRDQHPSVEDRLLDAKRTLCLVRLVGLAATAPMRLSDEDEGWAWSMLNQLCQDAAAGLEAVEHTIDGRELCRPAPLVPNVNDE